MIRSSSPSSALSRTAPRRCCLFEADEPDHVEDVAGFVEIKVEALLRAHGASCARRWESRPIEAPDESDARGREFRSHITGRLASTGLAGFAAGEAFKRIDRL